MPTLIITNILLYHVIYIYYFPYHETITNMIYHNEMTKHRQKI